MNKRSLIPIAIISCTFLLFTKCKSREEKAILSYLSERNNGKKLGISGCHVVDTTYFRDHIAQLNNSIEARRLLLLDSVEGLTSVKKRELQMYHSVSEELTCAHDKKTGRELELKVSAILNDIAQFKPKLLSLSGAGTPLEHDLGVLKTLKDSPDSVEAYVFKIKYETKSLDTILYLRPNLQVSLRPPFELRTSAR